MMVDLDNIDRKLLREISLTGEIHAGKLGKKVGLSQPSAWRRIKRFKEKGILKGRRMRLNRVKLGFEVTVFLGIKLATKGRMSLADFERAVSAIPEVQLVQHVLGLYDYRIKVVARDLNDFERVLRRRIMTLPSVGNIESNILLTVEKETNPLI